MLRTKEIEGSTFGARMRGDREPGEPTGIAITLVPQCCGCPHNYLAVKCYYHNEKPIPAIYFRNDITCPYRADPLEEL